MDLFNNKKGRDLASMPGTCEALVMQAVLNNSLQLAPGKASGVCGDPHIQKWDGNYFDYHGECDLVMLNAPDFGGVHDGLHIQIRTKIRYAYSYITSAAIKIGNDVLEVASFGQYMVNKIAAADLTEASLSGFEVTHQIVDEKRHSFMIQVGRVSLAISTLKDIVSVHVLRGEDNVTGRWFANSTGLMGSFPTGEMLARDGSTVLHDPNDFAQEWMVQSSEPQLIDRLTHHHTVCVLPAQGVKMTRRLGEGIGLRDAEEACSRFHRAGNQQAMEACISDVIAMNDLDIAAISY
ncbi:expressed unknown protein [Seminavis robusta]|uniref:VWFD domain-containing protein n=1 Tax=Seminavis robusta TaxID=568900 RepID=A0A9N8HK76_9STRA|nr:expressed unknown protein [Seminavis robusta]|eukprot:Sro598_g172990.1 n/a (293) ;mRNA; f:19849-20908